MSNLVKNEGFAEDPNIDQTGESMTTFVNKLDKGAPLTLKGGTNGFFGDAVLVGGSKVVATTAVRTGDSILLTRKAVGGTAGNLTYGTIVNKTSFVITSSSGTDTSTVTWVILRAAA